MDILVDADACPVKDIVIRVAKELGVGVLMFCDTSHFIDDGYSKTIMVDKGRDSVDIKLANAISPGDVVVTQDYGLAAMALAKKAHAINQNGRIYDSSNIEQLLFERHISQKNRNAGKRTKGPKKRVTEDDEKFERAFRAVLTGKH